VRLGKEAPFSARVRALHSSCTVQPKVTTTEANPAMHKAGPISVVADLIGYNARKSADEADQGQKTLPRPSDPTPMSHASERRFGFTVQICHLQSKPLVGASLC
jgi:hypothetical protein